MKKIILLIIALVIAVSCKSSMDLAMKSADKDFILKTANEKFAQKKWKEAVTLYERLPNLVAGTDDAPNVIFNSAYANYYDKNYKLAGHQFKNFSISFPQDSRTEEAAYMSALCYYQGSNDYNLDQTNTESAIKELQSFLNAYPNSERSKNINELIDELVYKLEFKAYENSRRYYKMEDYKAAIVCFDNLLNDYPATKLKENSVEYLMKSRYELAMGSRYDLKMERIDNAIAYCKEVANNYPNSKLEKDAVNHRDKLLKEKQSFAVTLQKIETENANYLAKQKKEQDKLDQKEAERKARKTSKQKDKNTVAKKSDSIVS